MNDQTLSNLLSEDRRFEPPAELAANANVKEEAYDRAAADPERRISAHRTSLGHVIYYRCDCGVARITLWRTPTARRQAA